MDDLTAKLGEILSNPESMQQIQSIMSSLNLGGAQGDTAGDAANKPPSDQGDSKNSGGMDPAMLQNLMNTLGGSGTKNSSTNQGSGIDPAMLQNLMSSLGNSGTQNSSANQDSGVNSAMLQNLMNAMGGGGGQSNTDNRGNENNAQMMQMMSAFSKIAPMMQQMNQEDDASRLLKALRPMLSPKRQTKLDEAIKIMRMMRMLPMLKGSGVLSQLF